MGLHVYLEAVQPCTVFEHNITHNLGKMAEAAGIYKALWRPEELGIEMAGDLIEPLEEGLVRLLADPDHYKQYDAANRWGTYDQFVQFVADYLAGCKQYPHAAVKVSR